MLTKDEKNKIKEELKKIDAIKNSLDKSTKDLKNARFFYTSKKQARDLLITLADQLNGLIAELGHVGQIVSGEVEPVLRD